MSGTAAVASFPDYMRAILAADRHAAFDVIDAARDAGVSLASLYLEVFQPTLREVGRLWQENEITVADEHAATAITQAAMARAFYSAYEWDGERPRSLVAACADTERHEVGLRMLCDLLEMEGWETTWLGAAVPNDSLVAMIRRKRPHAVAISAALAPHVPRVQAMIDTVRSAFDAPPLIMVGGRPFMDDPSLATRVGADLTANDAVSAVELLASRFASS